MTVSCMEVPVAEAAGSFGVMTVDDNMRVVRFDEKPEHPSEIPGQPGKTLASMGNYIFNTDFLFEVLREDGKDPRTRNMISAKISSRRLSKNTMSLPIRSAIRKPTSWPTGAMSVLSMPSGRPTWS
jgi:glucose-1-phosphate adenylyltransferase